MEAEVLQQSSVRGKPWLTRLLGISSSVCSDQPPIGYSKQDMRPVDEVRAAADIVRIVSDYVTLRKAGVNMIGLCPFHQEKTPSFSVHPGKQVFYCHGCHAGGDVFKFLMMIDSLTFPEALRRVAEKAGVTLKEQPGEETYDARSKERNEVLKMHEIAAKYFATQLGATVEGRTARGYLVDRGLADETIARFHLGYAPAHGQGLTRHLREHGFEGDLLEKSGLVSVAAELEGKRHFDRFRGRVIFPIANESGKVVAFGGRALGDELPKYLNSPETAIYTKSRILYNLDGAGTAIRKKGEAVLVEGYMDAIGVASAGVENVVASCGTSLTEAQIRLLGRFARRVMVNYDPDSAGVAATERSLELLLEEGFEVRVLSLPGGLDPDEFVRRHGPEEYAKRRAAAPGYIEYLTDRAASQHDLSKPEGRVAAANAILPYLARLPDGLLRGQMAQNLALRLRIEAKAVQEELRRAAERRQKQIKAPAAESAPAVHAVKQLLRACFESDAIADEFAVELVEGGDCEGLQGEGIFRLIAERRQRGESATIGEIEAALGEEDRKLLYESLFWPGDPPTAELAQGCRRALKKRRIQRQSEQLQGEIERAERQHDLRRVAELQGAKIRLNRELRSLGMT